MHQSTMLLISGDPALIEAARGLVGSIEGLGLSVVGGVDEAYAYPAWEDVALVMIHQAGGGPATQVERLLRMIAAARRPVATLVVADPYDADQALALFRLGVADYHDLPIDVDRLSYLIEILTVRARKGTGDPSGPAPGPDPGDPPPRESPDDDSPEAAALMNLVRRVAPQDTTILIGGETGTGKTRLARKIHDLSPRRDEPFVAINCGDLSDATIEGELFGHVRGAFPGAEDDRAGKLAEVGGGTLFLDDVDSLPATIQVRLLRAVEARCFEPVGSDRAEPISARLIAASGRSLEVEVAQGRFRSDLFYRLNVVAIQVPALRERAGAIRYLTPLLVAEFADRLGRPVESVDPEALRALERHDWPGNIRELRNVIERCVSLCAGRVIGRADLPASVRDGATAPRATASDPSSSSQASLAQTKGEAELARITQALEKHSNNRLRAASELGISRMTLYKKLYKYGIMQHSS